MTAATVAPPRTPPSTSDTTTTPRTRGDAAPWLFLAPFGVLYLLFVLGPTAYGFVLSFFDTSLVRPGLGDAVGFGNFTALLASADFWSSLGNTVRFTLFTTPVLVVLSLVLAVLVNRVGRGNRVFRFAFFLPYVLPSATVALIWMFILTPDSGGLATVLGAVGVDAPSWLGDPDWAMQAIAGVTLWWTLGFNFVLYLAALQDIPRELYEAAAIDGAGPWQQTARITFPLLHRTTALVTALQLIASLKVFDQIYLMTMGAADTRPVLEYVYDTGFTDYRVGAASAASMLYFLLILLVSGLWLLATRRRDREVIR
ncbi:carbohydrate ABC transporter permease [Lentzea albida]|uniref:Multiple sugar transport system permease protein n=1 Tax=Lentzea albida TaxID=65499 RepID=A0A1H9W7T7_9PSEU|nr:sugar ABC transporter permease [Lentzea albida]SES30000.1 multiple sugar transport system permease protein [Lentzea albida]